MMHNKETLILRLLCGVKVFAGFTPEDGKDLLTHALSLDVAEGESVLYEGAGGHEFYIILSGELSVVKMLPSGKEKVIANLRPGDSFGEMSFLDGRPRSASIVADSPATLMRFDRAGLLKIPKTAEKIYFNLASMMASRIRDTNSLISLALEGREAGDEGVPSEALITHRNIRRL